MDKGLLTNPILNPKFHRILPKAKGQLPKAH